MLKRLLALVVAVAGLSLGGCGHMLHCECPCYMQSYHRAGNHIMNFVDVYFLNYDKNDPYRCEPCISNQ